MTETMTIEVSKSAKVIIDGVEYKPNKPAVWKPKHGDKVMCLDSCGDDIEVEYSSHWEKEFTQGNIFETEEQAKLESKRRRLVKEYKDYLAEGNARIGWLTDWNDGTQQKYFAIWERAQNSHAVSSCGVSQKTESALHAERSVIESAVKHFGDDMKLIITGGE